MPSAERVVLLFFDRLRTSDKLRDRCHENRQVHLALVSTGSTDPHVLPGSPTPAAAAEGR